MNELEREWPPPPPITTVWAEEFTAAEPKIKAKSGIRYNTNKVSSIPNGPPDIVYQELEVAKLDTIVFFFFFLPWSST